VFPWLWGRQKVTDAAKIKAFKLHLAFEMRDKIFHFWFKNYAFTTEKMPTPKCSQ
jgi:hypothetical protein